MAETHLYERWVHIQPKTRTNPRHIVAWGEAAKWRLTAVKVHRTQERSGYYCKLIWHIRQQILQPLLPVLSWNERKTHRQKESFLPFHKTKSVAWGNSIILPNGLPSPHPKKFLGFWRKGIPPFTPCHERIIHDVRPHLQNEVVQLKTRLNAFVRRTKA